MTLANDDPAAIRQLLAELYPGQDALLLVPLCSPAEDHRHKGEPCQTPGKVPVEGAWTKAALKRYSQPGVGIDAHLNRITEHIVKGGNVGWCVRPGTLVIDADSLPAMEAMALALEDCQVQRTAKGAHFLVEGDDALSARTGVELLPGFFYDLRVAGKSQIVVEPSVHATGVPYRWDGDGVTGDLARPPGAILEGLARAPDRRERPPVEATGTPPRPEIEDDLWRYDYGTRNDALFTYACWMQGAFGTIVDDSGFRRELVMHAEIYARPDVVDGKAVSPNHYGQVDAIARHVRAAYPKGDAEVSVDAPAPDTVFESFTGLELVDPPEIDWVIEDLLPAGRAGVLIAPGGTGKGHFCIGLGIHVASGRSFAGFTVPRARGVAIVSYEDTRDDLLRRYHAAANHGVFDITLGKRRLVKAKTVGKSLGDRLRFLALDPSLKLGPELIGSLAEQAAGIPDLGLLVIDPLVLGVPHTGRGGELNDQAVMGALLGNLNRLAGTLGATILLAHHTKKPVSKHLKWSAVTVDDATGSKQITDLARYAIALTPIENDRKEMLSGGAVEMTVVKANYAPRPDRLIVFDRGVKGSLAYLPGVVTVAQEGEPSSVRVDRYEAAAAWMLAEFERRIAKGHVLYPTFRNAFVRSSSYPAEMYTPVLEGLVEGGKIEHGEGRNLIKPCDNGNGPIPPEGEDLPFDDGEIDD